MVSVRRISRFNLTTELRGQCEGDFFSGRHASALEWNGQRASIPASEVDPRNWNWRRA